MPKLKYKRVLLKISGEGLSGAGGFGIKSEDINDVARQITELHEMSVQVAVVVGAGNLVRGATLSKETAINRATADQMGMLATVINALALQDVLEAHGVVGKVLSAVEMNSVCELFVSKRAIEYLEAGRIIILAGGTGNPFFTTDTCAALRASQIQADVLIKATKVDGVYSADPVKDPNAKIYDKLSYAEVLQNDLGIMDHSAISLCRNNNVDIMVCNLMKPGTIARVLHGEKIGTIIS